MVFLHMLTFRLMVTMVAEFCSLVILIHNTLQGEITISSRGDGRGGRGAIAPPPNIPVGGALPPNKKEL